MDPVVLDSDTVDMWFLTHDRIAKDFEAPSGSPSPPPFPLPPHSGAPLRSVLTGRAIRYFRVRKERTEGSTTPLLSSPLSPPLSTPRRLSMRSRNGDAKKERRGMHGVQRI